MNYPAHERPLGKKRGHATIANLRYRCTVHQKITFITILTALVYSGQMGFAFVFERWMSELLLGCQLDIFSVTSVNSFKCIYERAHG